MADQALETAYNDFMSIYPQLANVTKEGLNPTVTMWKRDEDTPANMEVCEVTFTKNGTRHVFCVAIWSVLGPRGQTVYEADVMSYDKDTVN